MPQPVAPPEAEAEAEAGTGTGAGSELPNSKALVIVYVRAV